MSYELGYINAEEAKSKHYFAFHFPGKHLEGYMSASQSVVIHA